MPTFENDDDDFGTFEDLLDPQLCHVALALGDQCPHNHLTIININTIITTTTTTIITTITTTISTTKITCAPTALLSEPPGPRS